MEITIKLNLIKRIKEERNVNKSYKYRSYKNMFNIIECKHNRL